MSQSQNDERLPEEEDFKQRMRNVVQNATPPRRRKLAQVTSEQMKQLTEAITLLQEGSDHPFVQHAAILAVPSNKLLTMSNTLPSDYLLRLICVTEWVLCNMRDTQRSFILGQCGQQQKSLDQRNFGCEWHHYPDRYLGRRCDTIAHCSIQNTMNAIPRLSITWENATYGVSYSATIDAKKVDKFRRVEVSFSGDRRLHFFGVDETYQITLPSLKATRSLLSNSSSITYSGDLIIECVERGIKAEVSIGNNNQVLGSIQDNVLGKRVVAKIEGSLNSDISISTLDQNVLPLPIPRLTFNLSEDALEDFPPMLSRDIQSDV